MSTSQNLKVNWTNVPTRTITAGGVEFAYRELGTNNPGTPVVFLVHLAAVLDNWDPRVVDGFAAKHHVHQGHGFRTGGPLRVLDGRDDRAGNRADGAATRTQDDHRGDGPRRRRRHQQGGPCDVPRHATGLSHPSRPEAVPVLHQDARRDPRRQGISGTTEGTLSEP